MKHLFSLLVLFLFFSFSSLKAQDPIAYREGRLATGIASTEIEGSPYLFDFWFSGEVLTVDKQLYKPIKLKYNLFNDKLVFLGDDKKEMYFVKPVRSFLMHDFDGNTFRFRNGFPSFSNFDATAFYQVLVEGKVMLLKKRKKLVKETKEFNSSVVKKTFDDKEIFLVCAGEKLMEVKKDKELIKSFLSDQEEKMMSFIATEKLNVRKEHDLISIINYYNSL